MEPVEKEYIAHPAKPQIGLPAQLYAAHIDGVVRIYEHNAKDMLSYYAGVVPVNLMNAIGRDACVFHDLGKLLSDFQRFMHEGCVGPRINHVDSGVAYLLQMFRESRRRLLGKNLPVNYRLLLSAVIVQGHHIGLLNPKPDKPNVVLYGTDIDAPEFLRDSRLLVAAYPHIASDASTVKDYVDANLNDVIAIHKKLLPNGKLTTDHAEPAKSFVHISSINNLHNYDDSAYTALDLRLTSSLVFFADHTDTARADGGVAIDENTQQFSLRAKERIAHLDELHRKSFGHLQDKRSLARQQVYDDVSNCEIDRNDKFYLLEANVGSGKTLSGLKFALRLAEANDSRRILTFAPFTNIIDQISDVYENYLVMPDEKTIKNFDRSMIVAKHHHLTAYGKSNDNNRKIQLLKALSVNWFSPITISSVEQLISSLASNLVPVLKKINKLPGSIIIIEEAHTIPVEVWPWFLFILKQLTEKWSCKVIFVTGTPIAFWDMDFVNKAFGEQTVKKIINPETAQLLGAAEDKRVAYHLYKNGDFASHEEFISFAANRVGAKLIICSTTRNAAVIAQLLANKYEHDHVYHISTALTPFDRVKIMRKVLHRLKTDDRNFFLVGTSCIESGIDMSFDVGFVEARSVAATRQASGRINRDFSQECADVYVFRLHDEGILTRLTSMSPHELVLIEIMRNNQHLNNDLQEQAFLKALKKKQNKIARESEEIILAEKKYNLREVRNNIKCIQEFGIVAIVNPKVLEILNDMEPFSMSSKDTFGNLTPAGELGLPDGKKVTSSWLRARIQEHSFKITADEEQIQKRGLPCFDLESYWVSTNSAENEVVDKMTSGCWVWEGSYDSDFLGYMNWQLKQLGVPGVKSVLNPFEAVKHMF